MPFQFERLLIPAVILIEPKVHQDERGFFVEVYKFSEFAAFGIKERFVQDNYSRSTHAVLRGLHYQKDPMAQGKLVRAVGGEVFDVAVDVRRGSPTYGRWVSAVLSADNRLMLYVPPGFAHGFCVLSETADLFYKVTEEYSAKQDAGIVWNDPDIAITWPIRNPIISAKDAAHPRLKESDTGFIFKERL